MIQQLVERAHDPARATDSWHGWRDEQGNVIQVVAEPCLTQVVIDAAEQALGFTLPELLRRLYREVGNGGFGPGYGLRGLSGTSLTNTGGSAVDFYLARREMAVDSELPCRWPVGLLPICDWGCGIQSSLDCTRPQAPVIRHDPNIEYEDIGAELETWQQFAGYERLFGATWIESPSLAEWLGKWLAGEELFSLAYPPS